MIFEFKIDIQFNYRVGLSTGMVFKTLNLNKVSTNDPLKLLSSFTKAGVILNAKNSLINDLEIPAFICAPILSQLKQQIQLSSPDIEGVMMSGSGSSVYGISDENSNINNNVFDKITKEYDSIQQFTCKFINKIDDVKDWYN